MYILEKLKTMYKYHNTYSSDLLFCLEEILMSAHGEKESEEEREIHSKCFTNVIFSESWLGQQIRLNSSYIYIHTHIYTHIFS